MNVCKFASAGCRFSCLYTSGMGSFSNVQAARIAKTQFLARDRAAFIEQIKIDIAALDRKAKRATLTPCVRLNGTSDLPWENFGIMGEFPRIPFYDYTKNPHRMMRFLNGELPRNYSLTFSRSETKRNHEHCQTVLERGGNVAAVFSGKKLPQRFDGRRVFNGDQSDLRFLDPRGVVVGLTAKGKARRDDSGFVINQK